LLVNHWRCRSSLSIYGDQPTDDRYQTSPQKVLKELFELNCRLYSSSNSGVKDIAEYGIFTQLFYSIRFQRPNSTSISRVMVQSWSKCWGLDPKILLISLFKGTFSRKNLWDYPFKYTKTKVHCKKSESYMPQESVWLAGGPTQMS
jgi:hypothetical protein